MGSLFINTVLVIVWIDECSFEEGGCLNENGGVYTLPFLFWTLWPFVLQIFKSSIFQLLIHCSPHLLYQPSFSTQPLFIRKYPDISHLIHEIRNF